MVNKGSYFFVCKLLCKVKMSIESVRITNIIIVVVVVVLVHNIIINRHSNRTYATQSTSLLEMDGMKTDGG